MWRLGGIGGAGARQEDLEVEVWVEFLPTRQSVYVSSIRGHLYDDDLSIKYLYIIYVDNSTN